MTSNPDFLETLVAWADTWNPQDHVVTVHRSPTDRPKVSAWIEVEGSPLAGTVLVWATGEAEVEVYDVEASEARWLESFHFASTDEQLATLRRFAASFDFRPSGDIREH